MYNAERKHQFLNERRSEVELSPNTEIWFESMEYFEKEYDRDICEWTSTEIIRYMKYMSTPRVQTLIIFKGSMSIYVDWCITNRLVDDNQNHFTELTTETLCECIDFTKLRSLILTREELLENIRTLNNYSDQFIFLGLFEGINAQNLINVGVSDLEGNELHLHDGKTITISNGLRHTILMAAEETTWISTKSRQKEYDYIPSDKIIRIIDRKNPQTNMMLLLGGRFRGALAFMGLPSEISRKDIMESGRLDYIQNIMKEKNMSLHDVIFNSDIRNDVESRYGKIQNCGVYVNIYGKLI